MKTSHFPNPLPFCIALLPTSAWRSYFCLFLFRQKLICKPLCQSLTACASPLGYSCRSRVWHLVVSVYISQQYLHPNLTFFVYRNGTNAELVIDREPVYPLRTSLYLWLKHPMIQLTIQIHILSTNKHTHYGLSLWVVWLDLLTARTNAIFELLSGFTQWKIGNAVLYDLLLCSIW